MKWILYSVTITYPFLAPIKFWLPRGNEFRVLHKNVLLCNCFKFVASIIGSVLVLGKIPCSSSLCRILFSFISVLMSSSILCILLSFLPLPLFSLSFMLLSYIWISSFFFRSFFKNRLPCVSFITQLFHNGIQFCSLLDSFPMECHPVS